jgi:protein-S-isoprenylcysteine O-methyltransferase Ste14
MGSSSSVEIQAEVPPPQLTVGMPIDFSADVPILPPFLLALLAGISILLWRYIKIDINPEWMQSVKVRVAIAAIAAGTVLHILTSASDSLDQAGSGIAFTRVQGLATGGLYQYTRNPLYCAMVFVVVPALSFTLDSAWPFFIMGPIMFVYLNAIVIPAEEAMLTGHFKSEYVTYCESVSRWL